MKLLQCKCGKTITIDDSDFEIFKYFKFRCGTRAGVNFYDNYQTKYLGREILGISDNLTCDHIDKDKHNNCRSNLRIATQQQNNCNVGKRIDNKSGYKGVYFNKHANKYIAIIRVHGERIHLGCFIDAIEAAKAYDNAAIKYHGEFAAINFPSAPAERSGAITL